jgi:hypothetical protein
MSRWKAASIHLSISILIGLVALALLFLVWYPQPYFDAAGGQQLVVLLLGVDLILGPLLTLIVYKAGKKSLRFDLSVIALVQATALAYGLHVIVQARPAFIVAAVDRFKLVAANELESADLQKGHLPQFRSLSWTGPRLVAARMPTDPEKRNALVFSGTAGKDIEKFPEYYVEYAEEAPSLLARAKPLEALRSKHAEAGTVLDQWLESNGYEAGDIAWLPLTARSTSLTMLLDARTGMPLDAVRIDPW